jgi:hypothetical protein
MGYLSIVDSCLYPSDVGGKDFVTRPGRKNGKKMKTPIAPAQECVYFKTSAIRFLRFNFAMSSGFSSSSTNTFAVESLYSCSNVS